MVELEDLPDELLVHVLAHLDAHALIALSGTCHRLRSVALLPRLWYNLLALSRPFDSRRDYLEEYAWRYGHLAVDVQSDLAPRDEELFKALSFFPLHRSYSGAELANLAPGYLPWAIEQLQSRVQDLLILACRRDDMIAHIYDEAATSRHTLLVLRNGQAPLEIPHLPDWPLCATFLGADHVVVVGRFPAALVYDLRDKSPTPRGLPLSSHTIYCLAVDDAAIEKRLLICGHYKGRGSMEILAYSISSTGDLSISVQGCNRLAGVTTIVSCVFLPGGSVMTYDNYCHIYLWSGLHNAIRKIDHDGIGDLIPSDMVYKMFYNDRQLIFIDQYQRRHRFIIRLGHGNQRDIQDVKHDDVQGRDQAAEIKRLLMRQSGEMASLARRILGMQ